MAKKKKRQSFLKTWALTVAAGAFVVGSGVFIGLETALRQGQVAQHDTVQNQNLPPLVEYTDSIDQSVELIITDDEFNDDVIISEQTDEGVDAERYGDAESSVVDEVVTDSDDGGNLIEADYSNRDNARSLEQPVVEDESEATKGATPVKRRPKAPAPSPSAAVRLATGEQIVVPPGGRIDRYLASRGTLNNDTYDVKPGVGPEYYQPRPTD